MNILYWPVNYLLSSMKLYILMYYIVRLPRKNNRLIIVMPVIIAGLITVLVYTLQNDTVLYDLLFPSALVCTILTVWSQARYKLRSLLLSTAGCLMIGIGESIAAAGVYALLDLEQHSFRENYLINFQIEAATVFVLLLASVLRERLGREREKFMPYFTSSLVACATTVGFALLVFPLTEIVPYLTDRSANRTAAGIVISSAMVIVLVALLCGIYSSSNKAKSKLAAYELYTKGKEDYYTGILEAEKNMRRIKHDMWAHINTLDAYMQQNNYVAAREYLAAIENGILSTTKEIYQVGNTVVNMILNRLLSQYAEYVEVKGYFPENIALDDIELCIVFSNLVNNALEATDFNDAEAFILIEMKQVNRHLDVRICNSCARHSVSNRGIPSTTKANKRDHGFGIANASEIVEKYGGNLKIRQNGGIFTAHFQLLDVVQMTA